MSKQAGLNPGSRQDERDYKQYIDRLSDSKQYAERPHLESEYRYSGHSSMPPTSVLRLYELGWATSAQKSANSIFVSAACIHSTCQRTFGAMAGDLLQSEIKEIVGQQSDSQSFH